MSETCGACGRPKGDYHRRPVAGECTAPDPTDYTVSIQCLSIALRNTQAALAAARRECEGLRKLLWLRHGCSPSGLYGDDGEMQCNNAGCILDFKRQSPEEIEARWIAVNRAALAAPAAGEEGK